MKTSLAVLQITGKIVMTGVLLFTLVFLGMMLLSFVGTVWYGGVAVEEFVQLPAMTRLLQLMASGANIVAVMILYFALERKKGWSLGWEQQNSLQAGVVGAGWGICIMSASFVTIRLLGGLKINGIAWDAGVLDALLFGVILFAVVAVGEELLCRGYWYGLIKNDFGPTVAIISTSVIFAALHLFNDNVLQSPVPFINLLLAGILLGVVREKSGGLWMPIGIHFTWNLFQGDIFGFNVSGLQLGRSVIETEAVGPQLISGGAFGAEGSLVATVILLLFIVFFATKKASTA